MACWEGQCLICLTEFRHPDTTEENPSPNGTFCPVCRERNMMAPGVVHFTNVDKKTFLSDILWEDIKFGMMVVSADDPNVLGVVTAKARNPYGIKEFDYMIYIVWENNNKSCFRHEQYTKVAVKKE